MYVVGWECYEFDEINYNFCIKEIINILEIICINN